MLRAVGLGVPMGLLPAADLTGLALFQLMQAALGTVAGAATQIVMMMTSLAYMPAVGIAMAGTTLVGQSIGAGDRDWARKMGNSAIKLNVAYMGLVSLALALAGPWLLPLFVTSADPNAGAVVRTAAMLLWIGAAYQVFDGVNLGAGFALRGAGDVRVPTLLVVLVSWFGFVPLTHMLSFAPGTGLGALPAAVRPRHGRRLERAAVLHRGARCGDVAALAVGRVAEDQAAVGWSHRASAAVRSARAAQFGAWKIR